MEVYNLTEEQKNILVNQTYDGTQYFNPTLDANGNWFISVEEYNFSTAERIQELGASDWWGNLELTNYNPIVIQEELGY